MRTDAAGRPTDGTGTRGTLSTRAEAVAAAALGAIGVLAGAFGAHALDETLAPDRLTIYETAARYQLVHAVAAWAALAGGRLRSRLAARLFLAGSAVFSGSLYALALSGAGAWGAVTPIGGVLLVAGWLALAVTAWRGPSA